MTTASLPSRLTLAVLLVSTAILSLVARGGGWFPGDVRIGRWLQANPIPFAADLADLTNEHASGAPLTAAGIALAVVLLLRERRSAAVLIALATGLRAVNGVIKSLLDSPRPTADALRVTEDAEAAGFPSGHTMGAVLLAGAVAYLLLRGEREGEVSLLRRVGAAACVVLILLVGYGRVHSGAHWPSDVLGGVLYGSLLLIAAVWVSEDLLPRLTGLVGQGGDGVPVARLRREVAER